MPTPGTHHVTAAPATGRSRAFVGAGRAERLLFAGLLAIVAVMTGAILVSAATA